MVGWPGLRRGRAPCGSGDGSLACLESNSAHRSTWFARCRGFGGTGGGAGLALPGDGGLPALVAQGRFSGLLGRRGVSRGGGMVAATGGGGGGKGKSCISTSRPLSHVQQHAMQGVPMDTHMTLWWGSGLRWLLFRLVRGVGHPRCSFCFSQGRVFSRGCVEEAGAPCASYAELDGSVAHEDPYQIRGVFIEIILFTR